MILVQFFTLLILIGLFGAVYVTVYDRGYGVGWALFAVAISMAVSPIIVLLICMVILPNKKDPMKY